MMLSWGESGERKWGGPGVDHAGWEAWPSPARASWAWPRHLGWASSSPVMEC